MNWGRGRFRGLCGKGEGLGCGGRGLGFASRKTDCNSVFTIGCGLGARGAASWNNKYKVGKQI